MLLYYNTKLYVSFIYNDIEVQTEHMYNILQFKQMTKLK